MSLFSFAPAASGSANAPEIVMPFRRNARGDGSILHGEQVVAASSSVR